MNAIFLCVAAIFLPFLGTSLGAATVFFLRSLPSPRLTGALMGFAAGVMGAASVWSLLLPALERAEHPLTVGLGFLLGGLVFLWGDGLIARSGRVDRSRIPALSLILSVTLHNLPEGMAVGVVLAEFLSSPTGSGGGAALALAIGIALQNFPEGAVISLPLRALGKSPPKAFLPGFLSGVVEPAGALFALAFTGLAAPLLPFVLAFSAGAMTFVVAEELIPSYRSQNKEAGSIALFCGFVVMMLLDVILG